MMVVVWRVTERCNLGCEFCRYDRRVPGRRCDADPRQIAKFGKLLAEYQQSSADPVLVSWLGGEPMLWPPLTDTAVLFRRDFGLSLSLTTNGTQVSSPAVRSHLLENYAELTISVDGFAAFHNAVRHFQDGFESLRRAVALLAEEKRKIGFGPKLRANIVLMRDNLDLFEPLCVELVSWGIEEITFNQLGGNDRPEFYPSHRLLPHQAEWLESEFPRIRRTLADLGGRLLGGDAYLRRINATSNGESIPVQNCRPGESFLFIDERGRIAPCGFTVDAYGKCIDEIDSERDLRELPLRFAAARHATRQAACDDCHSTQVFGKFEEPH